MPYEKLILGPRWAVRLEDLAATDALEVGCMVCGHRFRIATHTLHDRYRAYTRLVDIQKDFRCPKCRAAYEGLAWTLVRASPAAL